MTHFRHAFLFIIMVAGIALIPTESSAATPPRVVALTDVASRPVEVAITTKHLTLIHFESGEVSMVAVGDPGIVSVTVKGADVLLKALTSSGSTNAFIWQGSRYTQWTFTVRQSSNDARVIIVRETTATGRGESKKTTSGSSKNAKQGANSTATPARQPATGGTTVPSATATPEEPSAGSAQPQPETAGEAPSQGCGAGVSLDHFVKTLNARQREVFGAFLTQPSLTSLQALLLEISPQQRCELLALLTGPAPLEQLMNDLLEFTDPAPAAPIAKNEQETNQANNGAPENCRGSTHQNARSAGGIDETSLTPTGAVSDYP